MTQPFKTNNMAQQTAVEYLIEEIKKNRHIHNKSTKEWNEVFREAKAMETDQSDRDYNYGFSNGYNEGYDKGMSDYNRF